MKKVYFAGSIRGGRDFVDTYFAIINLLKEDFIVLTEHIGDKGLGTDGEAKKSDEEIFLRDCSWIREADFVFAEISNPSLGVGYEVGYAESLGKPIFCLYQEGDKKISVMLSGNKYVKIYSYNSIDDVSKIINQYIKNK